MNGKTVNTIVEILYEFKNAPTKIEPLLLIASIVKATRLLFEYSVECRMTLTILAVDILSHEYLSVTSS